ncbi:MAG: hypothetical protein ABFC96_02325 [Thermoguttaceae bacterium]
MWRERVARSTTRGEELHLVVVEDLSPPVDPDECRCELFVNRRHLSAEREEVFRRAFANVADARAYCAREYGVGASDWQDRIIQSYTFQFDYEITNLGVPQPIPVGFDESKIVLRLAPREDENGVITSALSICGTREGLRRLAAMCLLCADAEQYDPEFHIHLENDADIESDIVATIRAPAYLDILTSRQFSEFHGTPTRTDLD